MINSEDLGNTYLDIVDLLRTQFIKKASDLVQPGVATPRNNEVDVPNFLEDSTLAPSDTDKVFIF